MLIQKLRLCLLRILLAVYGIGGGKSFKIGLECLQVPEYFIVKCTIALMNVVRILRYIGTNQGTHIAPSRTLWGTYAPLGPQGTYNKEP